MLDTLSEASRRRIFEQRARDRARLIETEVAQARERELMAECTFRPVINRSSEALLQAKQRFVPQDTVCFVSCSSGYRVCFMHHTATVLLHAAG